VFGYDTPKLKKPHGVKLVQLATGEIGWASGHMPGAYSGLTQNKLAMWSTCQPVVNTEVDPLEAY
jgi:hypothetical protein